MKKNQKCFLQLMIFSMILFVGTLAFAKRMPPPIVKPIVYQNVIYSASYDHGGQIEARSRSTQKVLWTKQIYNIKYDDNLEKDIQDVFIKNIILKKNKLLIIDEKERRYLLNLKKQKLEGASGGK